MSPVGRKENIGFIHMAARYEILQSIFLLVLLALWQIAWVAAYWCGQYI
jgi:hypothetical protein